MLQADQDRESRAQKSVARRYKSLGYDVIEHPAPDRLPNFLRDATPDIVALSESDNVVIEVKRHASLRGSNDLVSLADRVSQHPDWRFELVVLADSEADRSAQTEADFERSLERAGQASRAGLYDVAYVYLTAVLVGTAEEIARRHGLKTDRKSDRAVLAELGFKGILPGDVVDASLSAVSRRNTVSHSSAEMARVSEDDTKALVRLCEHLRQLN